MRARDLRVQLGLDWGNASPGCVLWGAALPNGHVHIFDEYKFQRMTAKDVAAAVKAKCADWNLPSVPSCACDPSLLPATKGEQGEWIGLTLIRHGLPVRRVSNDRVNGWQRVHEALAIDPETKTPWLTVHPRCKYLSRTLPLMVQAKNDPEDLDSDGDDHACVAGGTWIALERGDVPIEDVRLSDRVWTPEGLKPVLAVAMTNPDAELWEVRCDGRSLLATANHPMMVMGQQISLDALRYGDILSVWPETSRGVTETLEQNGDGIVGRFHADTKSIIRTVIREITQSRIWNACRWRTIQRVIPTGVATMVTPSIWTAFAHWLRSGTIPMLAVSGIDSTESGHGRPDSLFGRFARCVERPTTTSRVDQMRDFVQTTANRNGGATQEPIWSFVSAPSVDARSQSIGMPSAAPVLGRAVVASNPQRSGRGKVYNLTVDGGVYFANGILTHNCDALRYLLMGGLRPSTGRKVASELIPYSGQWWRKLYGDERSRGVLA